MDIDEVDIKELLYRHRHMKDNVHELRRKFATTSGIVDTFMKKASIKKEGVALKARIHTYEEVMTLLHIPYDSLDSGVELN